MADTLSSDLDSERQVWSVDTEKVGDALRKATKAAGLDGKDAARLAGVSANTVSNYFTGQTIQKEQFRFLLGLASTGPEARRVLAEDLLGMEMPDEENEHVARLIRRAQELRASRIVRSALEHLEDLVDEVGQERSPPRERGAAAS